MKLVLEAGKPALVWVDDEKYAWVIVGESDMRVRSWKRTWLSIGECETMNTGD